MVKEATTLNMPMGTIPAEVTVSDYRKDGDLLLPFHVTTAMGEQQFEIALDKIELNAEIPDSRFDIPAEIKALQK
jgi:outer membrane lipoprotein-sorting protein